MKTKLVRVDFGLPPRCSRRVWFKGWFYGGGGSNQTPFGPASHPALVFRAYWKGAVATSTLLEICVAIVRATSLRKMSPTTIPRTPPSGFWSAVRRPSLIAPKMSWGTWCEEFGRRFALQNWKEMVRSHPRRAWRCTTTGFPQADQKLDSVKLELLRWLGLCHCSAQLLPWQRRSLLCRPERLEDGGCEVPVHVLEDLRDTLAWNYPSHKADDGQLPFDFHTSNRSAKILTDTIGS